MEDPAVVMEDPTATDRAAVEAVDPAVDPALLGISHEFSIEYGLGWVFQWVCTVFGLGLPVGLS